MSKHPLTWGDTEWKVARAPKRYTKAQLQAAARKWLAENPPEIPEPPSMLKSIQKAAFLLFGIGPDYREPPMDPVLEALKIQNEARKLAIRAYCKAILEEQDDAA